MLRDGIVGPAALWFAIGVLATWRVTVLLCFEEGPWRILNRVRRAFVMLGLTRLIECFHCASVWVALGVAAALCRPRPEALLVWLALAGGASVVQNLAGDVPGAETGEHEP